MPQYDYDVIVIGSGPAGESAAMNASKHDFNIAVIEDRDRVGGGCTHKGTIPSKTLRQVVKEYIHNKKNPYLSSRLIGHKLRYVDILDSVKKVINQQVHMRSKFYSKNNIDVFNGTARFIDQHTIQIQLNDGNAQTITASDIIIATGARPYHPDNVDFNHPCIFDSDSILSMNYVPRKLIIYGAGVIGCEYASIFTGLDIKVDLINNRSQLLEFLDDEISDALSYHLREQGVIIRHNETLESIEYEDDHIVVVTESGKRLSGDAFLFCNGRTGNTEKLGLGTIGVEPNSRGQLEVDKHYRTNIEHVYAAGDVIGWPSLASAAYDQGRSAAASARGKEKTRFVDDVPTGIYTLPEISSIGLTEKDLTEQCIPYEIGRAFFKDTARAQISGEEVGVLKILFHTETMEILGIHCFGAEATEIVHIGQAIMKQPGEGNNLRYFIETTFNYPTMAEAYRIAALNGINRMGNF